MALDLSKDEKQIIINALNIAVKASENALDAGFRLQPIALKIQASMAEAPANGEPGVPAPDSAV